MNRLFEISKSGLASAQRSLTVTSNNIVNADTPGYTRQRVDKMPVGLNTGMTSIGLGVNISTATRLRNDMNDVLTNQKRQEFGFMSYKNQVYERLQATMTTDSGGDLDVRISRFFDMFSELANDPQDISVRNSLLSEAQQLTSKFMNIDQTLSDTNELIADTAQTTITNINKLLRDIQALNESVVQSNHRGSPDPTSMDIRVRKLEELAQLVDFTQMNSDSGAIEIRIGGIRVLDDENILELRSEVSPNDQQFKVRVAGGTIVDVNGGELGAQLDMYTNNIPEFRAKLDELANTLVTEINSIHSSGFGLTDAVGRDFFVASGNTAGTITINPDLISNPDNIAASTLSGEAGNGELAAQINELRNAGLINGRKIVDQTIEIISTPGSEVYSLASQMETNEAEIAMLQTQQERQSGVNIDEELANMIQFQNAYQGSARVMETARNLYDTLLGIVG
jgi:flagellar hook-associated protein 1 FlgK